MSNFDDIFEGNAPRKGQTNQPFDKEAWAEKKQAERQAVYDLADSTAEAVSADGSKFQAYDCQFFIIECVKDDINLSTERGFISLLIRKYVLVSRYTKHRDKLNK